MQSPRLSKKASKIKHISRLKIRGGLFNAVSSLSLIMLSCSSSSPPMSGARNESSNVTCMQVQKESAAFPWYRRPVDPNAGTEDEIEVISLMQDKVLENLSELFSLEEG